MNSSVKTVLFWAVIFVSAMLLWQVVRATPDDRKIPEIDYSRFMSDVDAGNVASVDIRGTQIQGQYRDGKGVFRLIGPSNPAVYLDVLRNKGVEIRFRDGGNGSPPAQLLGTWAPLILLGALWLYMIRQMQKRRSIPPGGIPPAGGNSGFPIEPR
ncbi:MAG: ATP-dependent metallopeptidase FtsH/Yme1/Tma family protein [Candidatus Sulfotelmatobacter sp.]